MTFQCGHPNGGHQIQLWITKYGRFSTSISLSNANKKSYVIYRTVPFPVTLSDTWHRVHYPTSYEPWESGTLGTRLLCLWYSPPPDNDNNAVSVGRQFWLVSCRYRYGWLWNLINYSEDMCKNCIYIQDRRIRKVNRKSYARDGWHRYQWPWVTLEDIFVVWNLSISHTPNQRTY